MKSQKHPDQRENLFMYHRQSIELWLHEELFRIKLSHNRNDIIEGFQHLLASATLVDFPQFCDIHHLIPQVLDIRPYFRPSESSTGFYHNQRDCIKIVKDSDEWEVYLEYRKIVSRFLIDQARSEIPRFSSAYFLRWSKGGQEHYVSLAKHLFKFLSEFSCDVEVDVPKLEAVLIFLPIVFSHAGRSAANLLRAGSFGFNPHIRKRFPQENWDQQFSSCFKACKLAIAAKGHKPTIPEPGAEIGSSSRGRGLHTKSKNKTQFKSSKGWRV